MNLGQARAAVSHYAFCGLSREHLGELATELAPQWEARCQSGRRQRRRGDRRCQAGAGPKCALVFTDRLLVTLVHLRTGLTYEALGMMYRVGSSTIGRAIGEIRPLLAECGFAVPQRPGLRLRTLADVFAYCQARALPIMVAWRIEVSLRAAQRSDTGCRCSHRGDSWRTPDGSRRRSEGGNRA